MIASHPNIATALLLIVALLSNYIQNNNSPFGTTGSWAGSWSILKQDYSSRHIPTFKVFFAAKWAAIGAAATLQILFNL
jgi:hypothetical protein